MQVTPDLLEGGAQEIAVALSCALARSGHEVLLVNLDANGAAEKHGRRLRAARVEVVTITRRSGRPARALRQLARLIRDRQPDVIHSHRFAQAYVLLAKIASGRRSRWIHTVHNRAANEVGARPYVAWVASALAYGWGAVPVGVSQAISNTIRQRYGRFLSRKLATVNNGVEIPPLRDRLGDSQHFRLGSIGRLTRQKNYAEAIKGVALAINLLGDSCDLTYDIWGDGEDREFLAELITQLGLDTAVRLRGASSSVLDVLPTYDLFVMSSLHEGLPLAALEAGAAQICAVVPALPELRELSPSNGLVFYEPGRPASLAKQIVELASQSELRCALASLWHDDVVAYYSIDTMADNYYSLYVGEVTQ